MIRCVAIDDEPLALKQLESYIKKTPFLELQNSFESPFDALSFIQSNQVDLIFIDINMPDLNGIDLVKSLTHPPKVIFTTAYGEFALEGFKVDAIDYLLKPIDYPTFLKASVKAKEWFQLNDHRPEHIKKEDHYLFVKSEYKIVKINLNNVNYIESMREYVRIHIAGEKPVMSLLSLKSVEKQLANTDFMRVHRSYIVNLNKVCNVERNRIVFGKVYIPISDQYKEKFQGFIDKNFLS